MSKVGPTRAGGYPRYALALLPLTRLELPGWGRLGAAVGVFGAKNDPRWAGAPSKTIRGKWHRYSMTLNLADWSERQTYFLGRYHDLKAQLLMNAVLRPGDRVVDVGANIGMLTLHGARLVGEEGIVEAFEPNPECADRIAASVRANHLQQVRLHRVALGATAETLTLSVLLNHTGMGTLAAIAADQAATVTQKISVPVREGDSVLLEDPREIVFVKVDVEGFETRALRGMEEVLRRWCPLVLTELIPEWLERAGSSSEELFGLMETLRYHAYGLFIKRKGWRHLLTLQALRGCGDLPPGLTDVAWLPSDYRRASFLSLS